MQKELLNQALALFDTFEKWNAFVEMANQKETMINLYFQKLRQPLLKYFNENLVEGWVCEPWNDPNYDMQWYLKDFGKDSLSLRIGWNFHFVLYLEDTNSFDTEKIDELLKTDYSIILSSFDRVDKQFDQYDKQYDYHRFKIVEVRNYAFNSPYDSNFDNSQLDKLAWYAGNETNKFADQIIRKVERFRKDQKLTRMLYELNDKAKIKIE
jgi:hypothetical protein